MKTLRDEIAIEAMSVVLKHSIDNLGVYTEEDLMKAFRNGGVLFLDEEEMMEYLERCCNKSLFDG